MLYLLLGKKKCRNCSKLSHTSLLFCWFCGCSFDQRICIAGHKNPAWVKHCQVCGKDRSLMSQPHNSRDLSFVKHPTRPATYVPGRERIHSMFAMLAVCVGVAILVFIVLVISGIL